MTTQKNHFRYEKIGELSSYFSIFPPIASCMCVCVSLCVSYPLYFFAFLYVLPLCYIHSIFQMFLKKTLILISEYWCTTEYFKRNGAPCWMLKSLFQKKRGSHYQQRISVLFSGKYELDSLKRRISSVLSFYLKSLNMVKVHHFTYF